MVEWRLKRLPLEGILIVKKYIVLAFLLLLVACQSSAPLHTYSKGSVLASYNFNAAGSFEEGAYDAATLQVINGTYEIDVNQGDNALWWGQWGSDYGDTVIDVDTEQLSTDNNDAYGLMCRVRGAVGEKQAVDPTLAAILQDSTAQPTAQSTAAVTSAAMAQATAALQLPTPQVSATLPPTKIPVSNGDGYLFLIQGGGSFAIMRSSGRNLTPLVDWKPSDAIHQGPSQNHLRAICAGTYLAFYVNDVFMGDATDNTYGSGQVGMAASAQTRLGTRVAFTNLTVSAPVQSK